MKAKSANRENRKLFIKVWRVSKAYSYRQSGLIYTEKIVLVKHEQDWYLVEKFCGKKVVEGK